MLLSQVIIHCKDNEERAGGEGGRGGAIAIPCPLMQVESYS